MLAYKLYCIGLKILINISFVIIFISIHCDNNRRLINLGSFCHWQDRRVHWVDSFENSVGHDLKELHCPGRREDLAYLRPASVVHSLHNNNLRLAFL